MAVGAQSLRGWDYANERAVGLGESPSVWLLLVGDAQRGPSPSCTSVSPGSPPALAKLSCRNATLKSNLTGSHSWHGQDGTEPRAIGSPLSPGSPFLGLTDPQSLSPPTPTVPPEPVGMAGTRQPDVTVPFAVAGQCHLLKVTGEGRGGTRGLNPGVHVALPPSCPGAPKMRFIPPADGVQEAPEWQGGLWGSFVPGGLQASHGTPQIWGDHVLGEQHPAVLPQEKGL